MKKAVEYLKMEIDVVIAFLKNICFKMCMPAYLNIYYMPAMPSEAGSGH